MRRAARQHGRTWGSDRRTNGRCGAVRSIASVPTLSACPHRSCTLRPTRRLSREAGRRLRFRDGPRPCLGFEPPRARLRPPRPAALGRGSWEAGQHAADATAPARVRLGWMGGGSAPVATRGGVWDQLGAWVTTQYPRSTTFPAAFIASSNGAAVHLAAAMGAPWLPQTFLVPSSRSVDTAARLSLPDDHAQREVHTGTHGDEDPIGTQNRPKTAFLGGSRGGGDRI
jgi:hypothetical protein